ALHRNEAGLVERVGLVRPTGAAHPQVRLCSSRRPTHRENLLPLVIEYHLLQELMPGSSKVENGVDLFDQTCTDVVVGRYRTERTGFRRFAGAFGWLRQVLRKHPIDVVDMEDLEDTEIVHERERHVDESEVGSELLVEIACHDVERPAQIRVLDLALGDRLEFLR